MFDLAAMPNSETVATIDIGSNSIKLLVARRAAAPASIETIFAETIETRISTGISSERPSLTATAIQAGTQTIHELVDLARRHQPREIALVATSAVRDAINGADFIAAVKAVTGLEIRVLSGTQEATYVGKGLACDPSIHGINHFIQMDIGGGSLELIRFNHGNIEQAISMQLGAVRLSERFIQDREAAISKETEAAIREHVHQTLITSGFDFTPANSPLIVTGGAFSITRTILAADSKLSTIDFSPHLIIEHIQELKEQLTALPLQERKAFPNLPSSRADIIPTALITIEEVLKTAERAHVTHSFYNLRYGVVTEMLEASV